ncbi:hypothetical protein [Pseudomonas aeruginosa]|uniref:hypothetical protein n=1 Tax=Pseudomonas aeruginosa TaxID=287 RepID=UPI001C95A1B8|nr:hypothetical protein [Pseudomonas aeruginosa]
MTQDVTRNLCARPALEIISKGRTEIIAWNQVVQGLKVLFNFTGIDVTEWKEAEPDMLELRLERKRSFHDVLDLLYVPKGP